MTYAYWHARIDALVEENNINRFGKAYWKNVAAVMPSELIEAYLNNGLTLPNRSTHRPQQPTIKIFEEEMSERILLG